MRSARARGRHPVRWCPGALGRNQARRYGPAPLVLGSHRVLPDLASQQWTEFDGDDQYLSATFNFGIGDLSISDVKIGKTAITTYQDVNYWLSDPSLPDGWHPDPSTGAAAQVSGNVDVIAGAALLGGTEGSGQATTTAPWTTRVAAKARRVACDFVGRLFQVGADGSYMARNLSITIELSAEIPPATEGGESTRRTITQMVILSNDSPAPLRHTWTYTLPTTGALPEDGDWQVRIRRNQNPHSDEQRARAQAAQAAVKYDDVTWQTLRVFQADTGDYRGHTRLAVRIRASGQLSGALDSVSATAQSKVPVYRDGAWRAPEATSNPAWLFRAVALGWHHPDGHLLAGAGLPVERIDDASIIRWGDWCDSEGLQCNYVVAQPMSVQALLELVAQCGRASPTWAAGKLGAIYENADAAPTALVSPGAVVAGSFGIDYPAGQVVDEVVCSYLDPDLDWQVSEVRRTRPGVTTPATSTSITLRGVTSRTQAAKEANLAAARQTYHRRRLAWEMGPGALTALARGDVVHITHALIDSGETGRLAGLDGLRLDLGRDVTLPVGTHHLLLELPDGRLHTAEIEQPDTALAAATVSRVTLADRPPRPDDEDAPGWIAADVRWRLYADGAPPLKARITSVEPGIDGSARFTAIDEVAAYYAAAGTTLDVDPPTLPGGAATVVAIWPWTESLKSDAGHTVEVRILIDTSGEWRGGAVVVSGAVSWEGRIERGALTTGWPAPREGTLSITVTPDGNPGGALTYANYRIDGPSEIVVPRWRGQWTSGMRYSASDLVGWSGRSYLAIKAHTSSVSNQPTGENTSNEWWAIFAEKGATGARGPTGLRGVRGNDGVRGADGRRYEWCYCRTPRSTTAIPSADWPDNAWGYDVLRNGARTRTGRALKWYDGSPAPSSAAPKLWWSARLVPANVRNDQTTGLGPWSAPHPLVEDGVDGSRGLTGEDGNGYEHVYARTAYSKTSFSAAQKPPPPTDPAPWGFDYLSTQQRGVNRGGVRWYDGSPPHTSGRSKLWWCSRRVEGTPALNARVRYPWSEPKELVEDGADGVATESVYSNCYQIERLLICWGTVSGGGSTNGRISFPATPAYASPPRVVLGNRLSGTTYPNATHPAPTVGGVSTTNFTYSRPASQVQMEWIAIGYTAAS